MKRSFISLLVIPLLYIWLKNYFLYEIISGNAKFFDISADIIYYFDYLSKALVFSTLLLFFSILTANFFIKGNQVALLKIYFPLVNITWFLIRLIAILIIGVFLLIIFLLFNYLIPSFKPTAIYFMSIIILFGGGLLAAQTILSIVKNFKKVSLIQVHGFLITEKDQPELFKLIRSISKKLNSIFPDNVILTSETNFFVSSAGLRLYNYKYDKKIIGNSLCIPLLVFKIFTKDELRGTIGHELAHFSGGDTKYLIKFSKMIGSLKKIVKEFNKIIKATQHAGLFEYGLFIIVRFFSITMLFPIVFLYENLIQKNLLNSKNKELRADKIGSDICEKKKSFITGLCKFCIYTRIWGGAEYEIFHNRQTVEIRNTLTREFTKQLDEYHTNFDLGKDLKKIMNFEMIHPSDDHPSILNRAKNLNIDVKKFNKKDLTDSTDLSISLIKNYDFVDKELTSL